MRAAAVLLAAAILCAGCGGGGDRDRLVLDFDVGLIAHAAVTEVVDCEARPRICEAVSARRDELLPPAPEGGICLGPIPFVTLHVTGRLDGEPVDRGFGNCQQNDTQRWIHLLGMSILEVRLASSGRGRAEVLSCAPAGGTVAHPPASCRALVRDDRLFPPRRAGRCGESEPGQVVTVYGFLHGEPLEQRFLVGCREPDAVRAWTELLLGFHVPAGS